MSIGVLDYGVGNIGSLLSMFRKLGQQAHIVSDPDDLEAESRLVLAGVGAYDHGMRELHARGLIEPLLQYAKSGRSLLGICLGMQILVEASDE
jgi:glutamine amidotransferase